MQTLFSNQAQQTRRFFIVISLVIAFLDGALISINYYFADKSLRKDFAKESTSLHAAFSASMLDAQRSLLLIANVFAEDKNVQQLFLQGKNAVALEGGGAGREQTGVIRQALYDVVADRWLKAIKDQGARQLHFHLGPGSLSFLRVHRPEKFGDRMDDVRYTIVDVNKNKKPVTGFETGRVYSGLRGMLPVFATDEAGGRVHVGAVEVGVSFDRLITSFNEATGSEITVLLHKKHVDESMWPDFVEQRFQKLPGCQCVVEATSSVIPTQFLTELPGNQVGHLPWNGEGFLINSEGRFLAASFYPLRDYLGSVNPDREDVGRIVVWNDVTERIHQFQQDQYVILAWGIVSFLFIELLLYWGLKSATGRLQEIIDHRTEALVTSEERFNALFEASPDASFLLDPITRRPIDFNDASASMLGVSRDEFANMPLEAYEANESVEDIRRHIENIKAEGRDDFETRFRRKDGSLLDVMVTVKMINLQGLDYFFAVIRDISSLKSVERELEQFRKLIQQSSDAIYIFDASIGEIVDANNAASESLGYAREELTGLPLWSFAQHVMDENSCGAWINGIRDAGKMVIESRHRHRDGHWFDIEANLQYIEEPGGQYILCIARDISAQKRARENYVNALAMSNSIIHTLPDLIWLKDPEGIYLACNPVFERFFGAKEKDIVGKTDYDFMDADKADFFRNHDAAALQADEARSNEEWVTFADDGHRALLHTIKTPMRDMDGNLIGVLGISRDITEFRKAQQDLQLAANVFRYAREGIMITDTKGDVIDVNAAFSAITGYEHDEIVGKNPSILQSGRHPATFYKTMWKDLKEKGHWSGEVWNRRKNGETFAELLNINAVKDLQGNSQYFVALFSDITRQKQHQKQLEHIAHYDVLTNLPNRVLLADRLQQAMAMVLRRKRMLAVAYLDLDGFKEINDVYGHDVGDKFLIELAKRFKTALRQEDTMARLVGDEFVAVLMDLNEDIDCIPLIERLLLASSTTVHIDGQMLKASGSVGVSFYPQEESLDADQLLRQADQAMYQAKLAGKNRYQLFDADKDRTVRGYHESLERIRQALTDKEFELHYQPKVNMRTGQVVGVEALIRWHHPERGLLLPEEFLPVVEDDPFAVEIGRWVIEAAIEQLNNWHKQGIRISTSINVGPLHLEQADFVATLKILLDQYPQLDNKYLELEVLESSALEDIALVSRVIESCNEIGVSFALDDFGTGYSSLTYLKRLPASTLKVDRSFIRDMLDDPDDLAILEGILGLSSAFRREVVAEGVETMEHCELLLRLGCDLAQGFGIARPMPATEFPDWLQAWRPEPQWAEIKTVSRDNLSLLTAGIEHRAWVRSVDNCIKEANRTIRPAQIARCRFGEWLHTEGKQHYSHFPNFDQLHPLHEKVHQLGDELCSLKAKNKLEDMPGLLKELHATRDQLLDHLKLLLEYSQEQQ